MQPRPRSDPGDPGNSSGGSPGRSDGADALRTRAGYHPAHDRARPKPPEDADYHPNTGGIIHEPAFFEAASKKTETGGRFGLAGWSSPNSPYGADYSEINGWLSFGFAFTWSSPPLTPARKPAPR